MVSTLIEVGRCEPHDRDPATRMPTDPLGPAHDGSHWWAARSYDVIPAKTRISSTGSVLTTKSVSSPGGSMHAGLPMRGAGGVLVHRVDLQSGTGGIDVGDMELVTMTEFDDLPRGCASVRKCAG